MFFVTLETVNVAHLVHALPCVNTTNVAKHTEESGDLKRVGRKRQHVCAEDMHLSLESFLARLFEIKMCFLKVFCLAENCCCLKTLDEKIPRNINCAQAAVEPNWCSLRAAVVKYCGKFRELREMLETRSISRIVLEQVSSASSCNAVRLWRKSCLWSISQPLTGVAAVIVKNKRGISASFHADSPVITEIQI